MYKCPVRLLAPTISCRLSSCVLTLLPIPSSAPAVSRYVIASRVLAYEWITLTDAFDYVRAVLLKP